MKWIDLKNKLQPITLILFTSLFLVLFSNYSFFKQVLKVYPFNSENIFFISSLAVVLFLFISTLQLLLYSKYTLKPIAIFLLICASMLNYFMVTYNVVIDDEMIRNAMQTDAKETADLLSFEMFLHVTLLGILPSFFIFRAKVEYLSFGKNLFFKIKYIVLFIGLMVAVIFTFSKFYTSFFREYKPLRYYTNPTYFIYSFGKYIYKTFEVAPKFEMIGEDAKVIRELEKKRLVIMVVGEATRADKLSLNGYTKETNPLLQKENILSFKEVYSCGTSTAHAVPCMFSIYGRDEYTYKKGIATGNALDVLQNSGEVAVLWLDNNSDSKGVATRVAYKDYRNPQNNPICDEECRDIGMLEDLDDFIENNKEKNIFIILHQMGSHGPAYYKRYTKEFEKFTPTCKTNQLEKCSVEEINNAYDNTVVYTDMFLSKTISFLKSKEDRYHTAMLYMSDHGESLGENGIYLHGMPYLIAPKVQKHIAALLWVGDAQFKEYLGYEFLSSNLDKEFSQDYLFHSILGMMGVSTNVYKKDLDIFSKGNK
jgi:lipid A ethanolaminephosphotransferase